MFDMIVYDRKLVKEICDHLNINFRENHAIPCDFTITRNSFNYLRLTISQEIFNKNIYFHERGDDYYVERMPQKNRDHLW